MQIKAPRKRIQTAFRESWIIYRSPFYKSTENRAGFRKNRPQFNCIFNPEKGRKNSGAEYRYHIKGCV